MTRIGFQLYSLHDIDDPLPAILDRVGDTVFEGVEFAGLGDASTDDLAAALSRNDLGVAGMHVDIGDIESDTVGVAATASELDTTHVVVPWLPPDRFETADAVTETAARLDRLADTLADHGVTLHYHNHDQEFATIHGRPALELLVEETDTVRFQVDLGWIGAAGYAPLPFLESIADRVDLVHLKDYDGDAGEPVPVGTGHLDVATTIDTVRDIGAEWLIYEAEAAPDTYDTLDDAATVVNEYW